MHLLKHFYPIDDNYQRKRDWGLAYNLQTGICIYLLAFTYAYNILLKNLGDILNDNSNFDLKTNRKSILCPILDFMPWKLCLPEQRLM